MSQWVAISYGALDLRGTPSGDASGTEVAVTPVFPGEPVLLSGEVADLWRSLVAGPVDDVGLSLSARELLVGFEEYGIASRDGEHPDRVVSLDAPWLSSPTHELVYALVAKVAQHAAVDAVFIKGPVLHAQGLRDREHSGDVDVWIANECQVVLIAALSEWGWTAIPSDLTGTLLAHATTLAPGRFGCELDIHHAFPGIGDSAGALAIVRQSTTRVSFAGVDGSVPARNQHAVIAALHELRPPPGRPVAMNRRAAGEAILSQAGASVVDTARALGAEAALSASLGAAFPGFGNESMAPLPPNWWWRTAPTVAAAYVRAVRLVSWTDKPRVARALLWPSRAYVLRAGGNTGSTSRRSSRLRRIARGVRQWSTVRRQAKPARVVPDRFEKSVSDASIGEN